MEDINYTISRKFFRELVDLVSRYQLLLEQTQEEDFFFNEMRKSAIVECEMALREAEELEDEQ